MKTVKNTGPARWVIAIMGFAAIIISILFVSGNLAAAIAYRKALFKRKPLLEREKVEYYKDLFRYISQANRFSPNNEDYHLAKAKILFDAVGEGLQRQLGVYLPDIEKFYLRAIEANPVNFSSHSHLGLFYAQQDNEAAEKSLLTALQLCPQCYLLGAELSNYYFSQEDEVKGFFSLLKAASVAKDEHRYYFKKALMVIGRQYAGRFRNVSLADFSGIYTIDSGASIVDLGEEGFPHVQFPVRIKVYTKKDAAPPTLYQGYFPYTNFTEMPLDKKKPKEYSVFGAGIDEFLPDVYLDDFRIEMNDSSLIDKVEISFVL